MMFMGETDEVCNFLTPHKKKGKKSKKRVKRVKKRVKRVKKG